MDDPAALALEAAQLPLVTDRMSRIEAAGFIVYRLSCGDTLTATWISILTGRTSKDSRMLLEELCRTSPIYEDDGYWRMIPK
jgi:hypothetical protein